MIIVLRLLIEKRMTALNLKVIRIKNFRWKSQQNTHERIVDWKRFQHWGNNVNECESLDFLDGRETEVACKDEDRMPNSNHPLMLLLQNTIRWISTEDIVFSNLHYAVQLRDSQNLEYSTVRQEKIDHWF